MYNKELKNNFLKVHCFVVQSLRGGSESMGKEEREILRKLKLTRKEGRTAKELKKSQQYFYIDSAE